MDELSTLIAVEEIKKLKARYFRTMDSKDWAEYRKLFTDDAVIDSSEAFTPLDAFGNAVEAELPSRAPDPSFHIIGADAFLEAQKFHLDGVSTVHHGHMPEIEILSESEGRGVWSMEDKLRWPRGKGAMREMHGYGHYRETYKRVDGAWRIASLKLTRLRIDVTPQD